MSEYPYKIREANNNGETLYEYWLIEEIVGEVECVRAVFISDSESAGMRHRYTVNGMHIHESGEPGGQPTLLAGDLVRLRYLVVLHEHEMRRWMSEAELLQRRSPDVAPADLEERRLRLAAAGHAIQLVSSDAKRQAKKGGASVRWQDVADDILEYCGVASYRKKGSRGRGSDAAAMARAMDLK